MSESHMSYVGKLPCGCIVAAIADKPTDFDWRKRVGASIQQWVVSGLRIEHVTDQAVRETAWECPECKPAPEQPMTLF